MPVKWDATKDQHILLHLINDPSTNINTAQLEQIIASWPTSLGAAPTVRAIREHFVKIKADLGFKTGTTPKSGKKSSVSTTKTPMKDEKIKSESTPSAANVGSIHSKTPATSSKTNTPTSSSRKRRRVMDSESEEAAGTASEGADDLDLSETPTQPRVKLERQTKKGPSVCQLMEKADIVEEGGGANDADVTVSSSDDSSASVFEVQD